MKKLLIVDDQILYLKSLEVALRKKFAIKSTTNYNDAIKILEEDIDIALIDIRLDEEDDKNFDGLKIVEWIKMNKPEISVLVISAYREFSYAERALNLGAKHFFKKPIDVISLIAIIEEKA